MCYFIGTVATYCRPRLAGHREYRAAIVALVRQCLDAKGQGPQVAEWEAEINAWVAWLYGLAADY